jgi:hypothetical protein
MCLVTDSSAYGIGAILYQVIDNEICYNGFVASTLNIHEQLYGSSKRELLSICYAFVRFRQWLIGRHFHLFVDNQALLYLHSQNKINDMNMNWYETIYIVDFHITYCQGVKNVLGDHLSRLFTDIPKLEGGESNCTRTRKTEKKKQKRVNKNNAIQTPFSLRKLILRAAAYIIKDKLKKNLLISLLREYYFLEKLKSIIHLSQKRHYKYKR